MQYKSEANRFNFNENSNKSARFLKSNVLIGLLGKISNCLLYVKCAATLRTLRSLRHKMK